MSTTTCPCVAGDLEQRARPCRAGPRLQRSGRGSPVTTVRCSSRARCTLANRSSSIPVAASRAADSRPETSSRTPRCLGHRAAVGVDVDQRRACSRRPGPPPARWPPSYGPARRPVPRRRATRAPVVGAGASNGAGGRGVGWLGRSVIAPGSSSTSSTQVRDADPPGSHGAAGSSADDRDRADTVAHRGGRPRPGRGRAPRCATTAASAWPAVAVASRSSTSTQRLSTTRSRRPVSSAQRAGLPGRPGREEQDDLHPRLTTVRLGAS